MTYSHRSEYFLRQLPLLCLLLLIAVTFDALANESSREISSADIAQSVATSLPKMQGRGAEVIASLDLTRPFKTRMQWTFMAAILPGSHFDGADERPVDGGALVQCFVESLTPHCTYPVEYDPDGFSTPIELYSARVVFAGADNTSPLLLTKTGSAQGGDGGHSIFTELFTYDGRLSEFQSVFSNATGSNNNQETRFIEQGPLRGDVIVADPTSSAPFGYLISVYSWNRAGGYSRSVLRCRSATHYGDGNHLPVVDSEMPGILRRMGLWRPGDRLPAPAGCNSPVLRHGEEWCQ
jgi:hypothetical protein